MAAIGRVLLMPKGAYSGSTVYNALDWVRHDSKAWVCKVDGTVGIVPSESANWTLLAADGSVSGSVAWIAVTGKPFDDVDSTDFDVNGSNNLIIKRDTFGTMRIVSGGTTTNLEASGDSVFEIDAGSNVTITADDTANPKKITINSTGGSGGSSTFAGLDDTYITNPQPDQIVQYKAVGGQMKLQNVAMPQGGHTMIANNTAIATMKTNSLDPTDDKVASTYAISNWSNAEIITLYTTIAKDADTVGAWNDNWKTDGIRTGWLWHSLLHDILSDDEVEIELAFDVSGEEVVSLYAYRVDDDVQNSGVDGGAIAIKLNGAIQNASGVKVAVNLKRQRTQTDNLTVLS